MFKDIIIGQYIPGNSFLHKMDPRVKLILTLLYIALLFVIDSFWAYLMITALTGFLIALCQVPLRFIAQGIRPMLFIVVFTAVFNLFLIPGQPLWSLTLFGRFQLAITVEGVYTAILMTIRLLYLVIGTSFLTLTTTPLQLTAGLESLLKPLDKLKVPSHEIAMMMTIAIRFIPTLAEETDKIMKAQTARGADFESGNLFKRAKALIPLLVPLFVSAFRRADELATAMEARCYHGGSGRTKMKQMHLCRRDVISTVAMVLICAGIITVDKLC